MPMQAELKYGHSSLKIDLPDTIHWQVLSKTILSSPHSQTDIISQAVNDLVLKIERDSPPRNPSVLIIVPDHTRLCQLPLVLPLLTRKLEDVFSARISILVANGSHVLQPRETIKSLVGEEIYDTYPVEQHDSRDRQTLVHAGTSSYGTPFYLNKRVPEADVVVTVSAILFHYFAGFGGGPKMIMPGVAGYETIRINHRRTIDPRTGTFHTGCNDGNLDSNPVYRDLVEIMQFTPRCNSIQVALDVNGEIVKAEAGALVEAQREIVRFVRDAYSIRLERRARVVIASAGGFPRDVNLIQAHKAIHHAFQAVEEGGFLVVVAECREGIGSNTFMEYFTGGSATEIGVRLLDDYKINGHTALALKTKTEKAHIVFVSSLDEAMVKRTGMIPEKSVDQALSRVLENISAGEMGYILPLASLFVPDMTKASPDLW